MDLLLLISIIGISLSGSFGFDDETYRCPSTVKVTRFVKTYGDQCFEFVVGEKSWYGAYDYCGERGGHLLVIRDRGTQSFVYSTLRKFHWPTNGVWLGATDRENEMAWKWVTNERVRFGYSNWAPGQPSCHIFCFEDCAQMRLDDRGRWHDYKCDWIEDYSFVCQYPLSNRTTTTSTTTTTTTTTTPTTPTTTTSKTTTTTSSTPAENSTSNATGLLSIGLKPEVKVDIVGQLGNSEMSMQDANSGANDTVSIVGLVLGLLLGVLLGLCFGVFFFRRRKRKEKEDVPNVYFHNPFYADIHSPLNSFSSPPPSSAMDESSSMMGCCGGGQVWHAPTPTKRPMAGPPVPKKDYDIPLPVRGSMEESQMDDITAEKLLYAQKCGALAVGDAGAAEYERYVEPRYVETPDDDDDDDNGDDAGCESSLKGCLVDQHVDAITGENFYESMDNVRLAMRQNALNEQQEERYVPFAFQQDELGYHKL